MVAFDRRRFIQLLSYASGAHLVGACGDEETNPPTSAASRIVVIGGGLAGLAAAKALADNGHEVTVLEAQARPGGRVETRRSGLAAGLWVETGAVRIPDVHLFTLRYAGDLGLNILQFPPDDSLNFLKGQRFLRREGDPWPAALGLTETEKLKGLRVIADYVRLYFPDIGDARTASWPPETARTYDAQTFADYLEMRGASEDFLRLYRGEVGTEIDEISALAWMATEFLDKEWDKTFTIDGGNDQIPKKLAEKLGDKIRYESPVLKLEHSTSEVKVTYSKSGGSSETLTADRCVIAIPPTVLAGVEMVPALPADKTIALAGVTLMAAGRVVFQTRRRFWADEGIAGLKLARTDTAAERIWDPSSVMSGDKGLIMSYVQSQNARTLCMKPSGERIAAARRNVEEVFPALATEYDGVAIEKCWSEDPWAKGGWSAPMPGAAADLHVLRRAEGRLHFAGEHTSPWQGWMNGALESGLRTAMEIGMPKMARRDALRLRRARQALAEWRV